MGNRLRRVIQSLLPPVALACVPLAPVEPPPSDPDGATCQEMCATMDRLGCEIGGEYCVEDCEFIESTRGHAGQIKTLDKGCLADATSCASARLCD